MQQQLREASAPKLQLDYEVFREDHITTCGREFHKIFVGKGSKLLAEILRNFFLWPRFFS